MGDFANLCHISNPGFQFSGKSWQTHSEIQIGRAFGILEFGGILCLGGDRQNLPTWGPENFEQKKGTFKRCQVRETTF